MSVPRSSLRPTTRRSALLVGFAVITALFPAGIAAAEPPTTKAADEVLVRYRADTPRAERGRVAREHGLTPVRTSHDGRTQVVVAEGRSPATARRELKNDPRVLAVADNHRRELTDDITDEPFFRDLWGLHNTGQTIDGIKSQTGLADIDIDGLEALRITRGDADVVVAVVDDGVDFSHPDLAEPSLDESRARPAPRRPTASTTTATATSTTSTAGTSATTTTRVSDPGEDFHGTHVAGTIAASLNGSGRRRRRARRSRSWPSSSSTTRPTCGADDMAIAAIDYAASFDVPIINASWGGPDPSSVLDAAIAESGALLVAAAATAIAAGPRIDLDKPGGPRFYPASSTLPNVVTVAAIDQRGQLASFSNYGKTSVDLAAPGTNVLSSIPERARLRPVLGVDRRHVDGRAARVRRRGARPQRPERHPDARRPSSARPRRPGSRWLRPSARPRPVGS